MRLVDRGPAGLIWLFGVLFLAGCSSGGGSQPVATVPPPQAPPAPAAPRPAVPQSPNGVRAEMIRWFSNAGYQSAQVEALVMYARMESGFRPCATNGPGLRYTFQWSGLRLRRLEEFAGTRVCPPLEKQLAFADHELRHEPNYACFLQATTPPAALKALRRGFGYGRC